MNPKTKNCQNCKNDFTIELEDFDFYEKIKVPQPTFCPRCRAIRRATFRNEHQLFKKPDFLTGEDIFSVYPKDSLLKIYNHDFWWSDGWDPMEYGVDYDFSRNFFEQIRELQLRVPWCSRSVKTSVGSDYSNNCSNLKNCYLTFNAGPGENLLYGTGGYTLKDSMDFYRTKDSDFCYQTFSCVDSSRAFWCTECANALNNWFCLNCRNCTDCFGCVNLSNKKYHIFNESYTESEYQKKIEEFNTGSYESILKIKEKVKEFQKKFPVKYMHTAQSPGSSGDYVYGSKNVKQSFLIYKSQDIKYCQSVLNSNSCYDYTAWGSRSELIYESVICGSDCSNLKFCIECWPSSSYLEYCMECHSSNNCFGCVGLKKKEYCIFNKQYSKEEYHVLKDKIIKHMNESFYIDSRGHTYKYGEFFPFEFSPFAYNDTLAIDYYPDSKERVISNGYAWREPITRDYQVEIESIDLPDHVNDTNNDILNRIIGCLHKGKNCECDCSTAYKIMPDEIVFYKRFNLPIPRLCPNCRFSERIKQLNPVNFWSRKCQCAGKTSQNSIYTNYLKHEHEGECPNKFETSYSPDRSEIIYCEKCYQQEVL